MRLSIPTFCDRVPRYRTTEKVLHVTPARVQGLEANSHRLLVSNVGDQLAEHPEWQPLAFDEAGQVSHTLSPSSLPSAYLSYSPYLSQSVRR